MFFINQLFIQSIVTVVSTYGLSEGSENVTFWNKFNEVMDRGSRGFKVIVLGDMRCWIDDEKKEGIKGAFGNVDGNDNGRKVINFCLWASNSYFDIKSIHKYTRVGEDRGGIVKGVIDLVLVKKEMQKYVMIERVGDGGIRSLCFF